MTGKLSILCLAATLALAGSAMAGDRSGGRAAGRFGTRQEAYTRPHHARVDHHGRVWAQERYETVYEKVWVEPVYDWVTREVWVPDRRRDRIGLNLGKFSLNFDLGGHHGRNNYGHYETIREQVLVRDGHYETITRQVLVRPERVGGFGVAQPYDTVRRLHHRVAKHKVNRPGSRSVRRASREFKTRH